MPGATITVQGRVRKAEPPGPDAVGEAAMPLLMEDIIEEAKSTGFETARAGTAKIREVERGIFGRLKYDKIKIKKLQSEPNVT